MKLRHHPALRSLPLWLLATAVHASVIVTFYLWYLADAGPRAETPGSSTLLVVLSWVMLTPFFVLGRIRRRADDFELTLPLTARRLWRRHVAAVVLAGGSIVALASLVAVAWCRMTGDRFGLLATLDPPRTAALLATGLVLAVLLLEGGGRTLPWAVRGRFGDLRRPAAAVVGVPWLLVGLAASPSAWTTLAAAAVAVVVYGAVLDRLLPAAFVLAEAPPAPVTREAASWETGVRRGGILPLVRWVAAGTALWGSLLFNGIWGAAFLSGLFSAATGNDALRLYFVPLYVAGTLLITAPWLAQLPSLDALPISRRSLFAVVVAAMLGSLALSYGVGRLLVTALGRFEPGGEGPYLPMVLALVGVPWLLLLALYLRACRAGWTETGRRVVLYAPLTLAVVLNLTAQWVAEGNPLDPLVWIARLETSLHHLGDSTAGTLAVWTASALALAAAYALAEAAFRRAEFPARPDWGTRGIPT